LFAKSKLKSGNPLAPRADTNYLQKLNPKEKELFVPAANSLITQGYLFLKDVRGAKVLALTDAGYIYIYPVDKEQVFKDIKDTVLNQFRSVNAKSGAFIPNRSLMVPLLNPREQELLQAGLQNIKDEGYITFKDGSLPGISLTEAGFDYIYQ